MQGKARTAGLVVGALLVVGSLSAQEDAAAETLFNKGLSEMEAGRFETACPTLQESQRLGPRMGTLFTLAECEAKGGMIASAVAHYEEYLRQFARLTPQQKGTQAGREKISAAQKAALEPLVPYVTLTLPADAPRGTTVKWDDLVFNLPALGVPLPVNPGEHTVTMQLPDGPSQLQRVTIEKSERKQIYLALDPQVAAKHTPLATTQIQAGSSSLTNDGGDVSTRPAARKMVMYAAGGLGAASLLVGSVTGALVIGKKDTIEDNCAGTSCNATGKQAADSAQSLGLVSTIGFAVGVAGLATAAVLLLTEPRQKAPATGQGWTPLLADRNGGLVLGVTRTW